MTTYRKCYACNGPDARIGLPKDRQMLGKWLLRLNIEEPTVLKKICTKHFRPGDFERGQRLRLKKNVVPLHISLQPTTESQDVVWFDSGGGMHRCHKVILSQSPFLKSLLIDSDKDDEAKIFTPDVPGSIVSLVLDALYKGEVTSSSWSEYELLRESLINLQVIGSGDCPRLPFGGVFAVGPPPVQPPVTEDWSVAEWKEKIDLFTNVTDWCSLAREFKKVEKKEGNEKYAKRYSNEELQHAIMLFNGSRKTYNYMKKNNLLKLPSSTTISARTSFFQCKPAEVQDQLLSLLQQKLSQVPTWQKKVSLIFDEVILDIFNYFLSFIMISLIDEFKKGGQLL